MNSERVFFSRRFWALAAALWTTGVIALAVSPEMESSWVMKNISDKILHGLAFTVGAIIWTKTAEGGDSRKVGTAMASGAFASLLVGGVIEILQRWVPRRSSDIWDFVAVMAGVLVALAIIGAIRLAKPTRS